jgi:hypothetical protein
MLQLNTQLIQKANDVTRLSQRQLSDVDRTKLESLPATLLQLHQSEQQNIELQSKVEKTEQMWSQALGNEKATMNSVSDLQSKFSRQLHLVLLNIAL